MKNLILKAYMYIQIISNLLLNLSKFLFLLNISNFWNIKKPDTALWINVLYITIPRMNTFLIFQNKHKYRKNANSQMKWI